MKSFDEVVERLTERLKVDPELRAEVGNELRGHLEESAKAFVEAGRNEEEARAEAVRAMGEEKEISDALWEGNKRRVMRRRVGRWVVGGTLVAGAGGAAVMLVWGVVASVAVAVSTMGMLGSRGPTVYFGEQVIRRVTDWVRADRVERMTPEERAVFEAGEGDAVERIERSGRLVGMARTPGDRVLFAAHYAVQVILDHGVGDGRVVDPGKFERALSALEAGKGAEPGNGFYAMEEASLLLGASAEDVTPPDTAGAWRFETTDERGEKGEWSFDAYRVTDAGLYARGLAQLREAARGTYVTSHVTDFESRRLAAMGRGTRLADEYLKAREDVGVLLPYLNPAREAMNIAGARAIELAQAGKVGEGMELILAGRRVSRMWVGGEHGPLIELLVGVGIHQLTLAQEAMVRRVAGDEARFAEASGRLAGALRAMNQWRKGSANVRELAELKARAGSLDGLFFWSGMRAERAAEGLAPGRRAEYAVADEVGVTVWVVALMLAGVWPAAGAVWRRWRSGAWEAGVFIGWGRLARVVGWSVVVPVVVYGAYAAVPVVGGRDLAVSVGWDRLLVEYAVVGAAVIVMLRVTGGRAIAARARELGMSVDGGRVGRGKKVAGAILAVAVAGYLMAWHWAAVGTGGGAAGVGGLILSVLVVAYALSWLSRGGGGTKDWKEELPGWVLPVSAAGVGVALVGLVYGSYGYRTGQAIVGMTSWLVATVAVAILLIGVVRGIFGASSRKACGGTFGYGVTMGPVLLAAALVLAVGGGGVARWCERRSVAGMEAVNAGGTRMAREVGQSNLATMRDVVMSGQE